VTILGGEPFLQLDGLLALMVALNRSRQYHLFQGYMILPGSV
jgi:hypothetical protein